MSWDEIFTEDSVDAILNIYLRIFYHSFPFKKCHPIQVKKAWITTGIKISCQHKRDLYLLCRGTKNPKFSSYNKKYCKILTEVIKTARKLHYNKLITNSNNKVKTMWNIVKTDTQKIKKDEIPPMNVDGSDVEDHHDIANIFNTYFTTVTDKIGTKNLVNVNSSNHVYPLNYLYQVFTSQFPSIKLTPVTSKEISEIIESLKQKNSHGYDEISVKILKISLPFIVSPLTYICNGMSTGIFPMRLKYSQINPVFKKGNKTEISNYRPISLLTSFSKVFEKVIYKRLFCHINTNNILATEQYGFRSNSSTETVAYNLINNISEALNSNKLVGGIFCDLTKAFDYVNHNILLSKLEFYCITGKAKNLIKSYLNDRYQRVRIKNKYLNNRFSKWEKVKRSTTGLGSWPLVLSSLHY